MTVETLPAPGDTLHDEREVASEWKIAVNTLRNWRAKGQGPRFVKIGGRAVRYRRSDLDAFLAAGEKAA